MTSGLCRKTRKIDSTDGLSVLPDEILSHILSFLPTEKAIATCVLSKRWRYLWIGATSFHFQFHYKISSRGMPERFSSFIDRVLRECTSKPIQRFYLYSVIKDYNFDRVKPWIDEAIRRNVCELDLSLKEYPSCVFTSKTLTVLRMLNYQKPKYEIPSSLSLPSLRVLHMRYCYPNTHLIEKLIQDCPMLEDVTLEAYIYMENFKLIISSPVLKRLKLYLLGMCIVTSKVVIDAPNLKCLNIKYPSGTDYKLENLTSIAEADVYLNEAPYGIFDQRIHPRAVELLRGLSAVKSLTFQNHMNVLDFPNKHHLPLFDNMTQLKLINRKNGGWKTLPRLLEVSPKLKVLILDKWRTPASDWEEPKCLSQCLEVVTIKGSTAHIYDLKVVEYLLEHAAGLKNLNICFEVMEARIVKVLMKFPRISRPWKDDSVKLTMT